MWASPYPYCTCAPLEPQLYEGVVEFNPRGVEHATDERLNCTEITYDLQ